MFFYVLLYSFPEVTVVDSRATDCAVSATVANKRRGPIIIPPIGGLPRIGGMADCLGLAQSHEEFDRQDVCTQCHPGARPASLRVELLPIEARDAAEIERTVTAFARSGNGGLIVPSGQLSFAHRELIITLAARERLPAAYGDRVFVTRGGLISYDPDRIEQYRRAAGYVDRILRGEKPADLPVQAPTKYDLIIISRLPRRST
jgi:hypothetical protein